MAETRLGDLITLDEAAERYKVKRDRLRRATLEGRLPAHKLGPKRTHPWLVRPEDVERYLLETRKGPKPRREAGASTEDCHAPRCVLE